MKTETARAVALHYVALVAAGGATGLLAQSAYQYVAHPTVDLCVMLDQFGPLLGVLAVAAWRLVVLTADLVDGAETR